MSSAATHRLAFQTSSGERRATIPSSARVHCVTSKDLKAADDPLRVVAQAIDDPVGRPPLSELATDAGTVTLVVPDRTRPAAAHTYLLPLLARLALAGIHPGRIRMVVARGIHTTSSRDDVRRLVGDEIMETLRPVQSSPDAPEANESIGSDAELGNVRVHRLVAEAGLVILTGAITPHHLAGFGGGPKSLVPGVAERDTVVAAHRLTLDVMVRPDGSVTASTCVAKPNGFRNALYRVAGLIRNAFLLNVILTPDGRIVDAIAGDVREAHEAGIERWKTLHALPTPRAHDCVVVHSPPPTDGDLIQAHKTLLRATAWAKPGAPIVWLADAPQGPGHPSFLPWFESGKLHRHLAALREQFHPYGLTAYSIRRIAKDHPVHVVSSLPRDILRPMGLLAFGDMQKAIDFAWHEAAQHGKTLDDVVVLPGGGL